MPVRLVAFDSKSSIYIHITFKLILQLTSSIAMSLRGHASALCFAMFLMISTDASPLMRKRQTHANVISHVFSDPRPGALMRSVRSNGEVGKLYESGRDGGGDEVYTPSEVRNDTLLDQQVNGERIVSMTKGTCDLVTSGKRQIWVTNCKGVGCKANGQDVDCAWCVEDMSK